MHVQQRTPVHQQTTTHHDHVEEPGDEEDDSPHRATLLIQRLNHNVVDEEVHGGNNVDTGDNPPDEVECQVDVDVGVEEEGYEDEDADDQNCIGRR